MLQDYYPQKDAAEIQKLFGGGFTQSLTGLAPEKWHGPVLSGYGTHLVYVYDTLEDVVKAYRQQTGAEAK